MRLAIFGATGRTGQILVAQALAAGHQVRALARNPAKLQQKSDRLEVIQGDVQDPVCVNRVISGVDAVISVLGPTSNEPVFAVSRGMDNILEAMSAQGVKRLVISTGAGVRDMLDAPGLFDQVIGILLKLASRNVYEDMRRAVEKVRASDTDWTVVRAPMLVDSPGTGKIKSGYVGKGIGARISRSDLADFMLQQVEDTTWIRKAPAVSGA